jgi:hypothetical protein
MVDVCFPGLEDGALCAWLRAAALSVQGLGSRAGFDGGPGAGFAACCCVQDMGQALLAHYYLCAAETCVRVFSMRMHTSLIHGQHASQCVVSVTCMGLALLCLLAALRAAGVDCVWLVWVCVPWVRAAGWKASFCRE